MSTYIGMFIHALVCVYMLRYVSTYILRLYICAVYTCVFLDFSEQIIGSVRNKEQRSNGQMS